ncbi:MAG TPA: exosortase A [Steroidobacteraceae bacterium]|nr:exosortase A [Steroidobacteraceae bacterium]
MAILSALVAFILLIFRYETVNAVQVWWIYETYTHCFLIIPISGWLIWQKRHELQTISPTIAPSAVLAIPPLLLLWLMGKYATINEVRQFAVVGLIQIAVFTTLGAQVYRTILFPVLYLFFLVPVGQYLVAPMQDFATRFTDISLTLLGVPHYTEGTLIELATGRFEIAEACAGLRFMIATVTLGVLYAHLTYTKWYKIASFLVACIVVPLIGNGLRCVAIIMLAYYTNNTVAVGADHLVYGWVFNVAILLILLFLGGQFRDSPSSDKALMAREIRRFSRLTVLTFAGLTALVIYLGPAYANWRDTLPVSINTQSLADLPQFKSSSAAEQSHKWKPIYTGADQEVLARLSPTSEDLAPVDLAIEFYGRMREGRSMIATTNRLWDPDVWRQIESRRVMASVGTTTVQVGERVLWSTSERRLLWSVYWMDGVFTTSATRIKLLQLKTAFVGNPAGALIALSTPIDGSVEDARLRLKDALSLITDLPSRLVEAGRPTDTRTSSN